MGFWKKLLTGLRIGAAVADTAGVKVKGVSIGTIRDAAEGAVKDAKVKRPTQPKNSTGE